MPVLSNPRHEAFAQAIFSGIVGAKGNAHSQAEAYRRAGYYLTNGNSARACASRLLTFANGIAERVRELQEEAAERAQESADKCVQELNQLRRDAHSDKAYGAAVVPNQRSAFSPTMFICQSDTKLVAAVGGESGAVSNCRGA